MMNNLFSIFDPSTSHLLSLNWLSLFTIYLFLPCLKFIEPYRSQFIYNNIISFNVTSVNNNMKKSHFKTSFILMSIFLFIFSTNLLSLLPFYFNSTSHLSVSLALALPLWLGLMLKSCLSDSNMILSHLLPSSTPLPLCSFMITIEIISLLIRPLTLAIRLSANMIAGHLLMTLLSLLLYSNILIFIPVSLILDLLMILEFAVSMIQSFVFITLMSLYINETH